MKAPNRAFLQSIRLQRGQVSFTEYPFRIPAIAKLRTLKLHPKVTFFIGENGSGKSTLLEAIAVGMGFNAEGGSRNFNFSTRASHSSLCKFLELDRGSNLRKPRTGYFLRAESYFNVATEIEKLDDAARTSDIPPLIDAYGGVPLHEQSHGESFFALMAHRFGPEGIYILDEPEAALSPRRQLSCLTLIHQLVSKGSQFIIATHSPILMAYPDATIYEFSEAGIKPRIYEETEHYVVTRDFLNRRDKMLKILLEESEDENDNLFSSAAIKP
jgi:predicted ATPase